MYSPKQLILLILATSAWPVFADYVPDTLEFPASPPLTLDAHPVLSLVDGGAIEFWVVADWQDNPGYHPVILANGTAANPLYQVSITDTRDALLVQAGADVGLFRANFADGQTHHVAILDFDDQIVVMVDGKLTSAVTMSIEPGPVGPFVVGSAAGGASPFVGAVSALRIWDVPLEPEQIPQFALRDESDPAHPHPNFDHLVGRSNFRERSFEVVESVVLKAADLMSRQEAVEILGEQAVLTMELEYGEENDE